MSELEMCELAKRKGYTYNPKTGEIKGVRGKVITSKDNRGYIQCSLKINKKVKHIRSHRLGWYLYYGKLPNKYIDHIDGNPANNKIDNLRDVTNQQNSFNQTKAKGYYWNSRDKKFQAQIRLNLKTINLGLFSTKEEARAAYLKAKEKYHVITQIKTHTK
jgi:hypothetical protein